MKTKKRKKRVSKTTAMPQSEHQKLVPVLEDEGEMGRLYQDFALDDNEEINDIVSGRIGEIAVEW